MHIVSPDLPHVPQMLQGLERHFGLQAFREGQAEVISSVLSGRNTVALMPTGAGKSLCYQLPAMLLEGVTVVVSPLIALMHDQVEALERRGIAATYINSSLSESERADRIRRLRNRDFKLVYVAPERFRSENFVSALTEANLSLLAIDEAHCISQWGHDFRPDYAQLGQIRKRLRPPKTMALTATATPEVREDIVRVLLMKDPNVFVAGFDRPNLFLDVLTVGGDDEKRRAVSALAERGSGIVYCSTRKQAENLFDSLERLGVETVLYHAGMDDDARRKAQESFMEKDKVVAVATNAFGMGIDKPNIRFVAHASIPKAVEAYYQEIGRAGRDGQPAHAVLLFNHADVYTQERLIQSSFPPERVFREVWNTLRAEGSYERGVSSLANQAGCTEFEVSAVLKQLERDGVLARAGRGDGRYEFTLASGATSYQPRSADAQAVLKALVAALPHGKGSMELYALSRRSGLDEDRIRHGMTLLERNNVVTVVRPFAGRSITVMSHDAWDSLNLDHTRFRTQEKNQLLLLKRMTDYAYGKRCRRAFLLRYFGERVHFGHACASCDVCAGPSLTIPSASSEPKITLRARAMPERYSLAAAEALRRWRKELAQDLGMPPFILFNDQTLYGLAAALPVTKEEFMRVKGTGEARWERFGAQISAICARARASGEAPHVVETGRPKRARQRSA